MPEKLEQTFFTHFSGNLKIVDDPVQHLSLAPGGTPDSGGIGYTAFGKVVSGMDVVNKIAKTPKGKPVPPGVPISPNDLPKEAIVITKATVVETAAAPAK